MRKIVSGLFMSLDGVVESPSSWASPYFDDELFGWMAAGLPQADAIVLGRRTYLEFAELWPDQGSSLPMARFLNDTPKYVVSSTLETLEWGPATRVRGELAAQLEALQQQPGRNIQIPGSPMLVRSLMSDGLLDELSLAICPLVVGSGTRLFEEIAAQVPLQLVDFRALSSGVLAVTYQREERSIEPARTP
jgi:dihydrofolate reductase